MVEIILSVAMAISTIGTPCDEVCSDVGDIPVVAEHKVVRDIHKDCADEGWSYGYALGCYGEGNFDESEYDLCNCSKFVWAFEEGYSKGVGTREAIEHGHPLVVYDNGDCKEELPTEVVEAEVIEGEVVEDEIIELY